MTHNKTGFPIGLKAWETGFLVCTYLLLAAIAMRMTLMPLPRSADNLIYTAVLRLPAQLLTNFSRRSNEHCGITGTTRLLYNGEVNAGNPFWRCQSSGVH